MQICLMLREKWEHNKTIHELPVFVTQALLVRIVSVGKQGIGKIYV